MLGLPEYTCQAAGSQELTIQAWHPCTHQTLFPPTCVVPRYPQWAGKGVPVKSLKFTRQRLVRGCQVDPHTQVCGRWELPDCTWPRAANGI